MITARLFSASSPVEPTTAAIAPKAPIGASPHDHGEDLEDEPLDVPDAAQDRLARRAHGLHGEADEQRDEQRLQHLALGERRDQRRRDDAEQEVDGAGVLAGPAPGPRPWTPRR